MLPFDPAFAYLTLGCVAGFFAGLLGVGGGIIVVPVLSLLFALQDLPADLVLPMALGTSMATILFTSLSSLRAHHRHRAVLWQVVLRFTPGILVGTGLGTLLAAHVSGHALSVFFVAFMLFVAFQMLANVRPAPSRGLPGAPGLAGAGVCIGTLSSLVAIGGGALTVPFLVWCNVRPHQAIGTSAAVGFPIALGGTAGFIINGLAKPHLPAHAAGFIFLPALAWILAASLLTAPLGARLAHRLPVGVLKRVFAGLLLVLAAHMLYRLYR